MPEPAYWAGDGVPSPIFRTNRAGGGVGTSPGINPLTPYTTAALDYRASWIAGEVLENTKKADQSKYHLSPLVRDSWERVEGHAELAA